MTTLGETMARSVAPRLVFVTGPSGAGRTTALNALEDLGWETISNVPLSLVPRLAEGPRHGRHLAVGLDARNRDFSPAAMIRLIDRDDFNESPAELLYIDCRPEVLLRRYSETRRRHPLAPAESPETGIAREIDLLATIRARADFLIDTSDLTVRDLREVVHRQFEVRGTPTLAVTVNSFSYKRGMPHGVDMVLDCRFLRNPYWNETLRHLDGTDPAVATHVEADPRFEEFFGRVLGLVQHLLPAFHDEGKAHLSIGFGCTGGQHRSVAVAEKLARALAEDGWQVSIRHRELERRGPAGRTVDGVKA
jgi:UPF0042 nucleotide-binding protein